ncbi:hypothetical protein PhCBS80983_g01703 [Powellomyces hirtus]|uniref:Uncharacterized protein n=1 Tax=Powellomyces hirtus TaxID=109895 RepID=A0A507EBH8_9FUNG|nr:hypothetical protein PhCBS80983_g01703 [Powellomyces hirtus]
MASEEEIRMMEMMGLPVGFGAKKKDNSARANVAFEETRRKDVQPEVVAPPALPHKGETKAIPDKEAPRKPGLQMDSSDDDSEDDKAASENEAAHDADTLPISHQAALKDHMRTVSALSMDPAGARFASGGRDCMVKLWDFHGMDASLKPFRSFEATSGNPIRDIQFSPSGDQILVASSSAQAKLYDRDGLELVEFFKGDPYIRDMRHTKGHVAALTGCKWHPTEKSTFLTSSLDSTIRIWDVTSKRTQKQVIAVKSRQPGGKTAMTSAAYSHDGKLIVGGAMDGTLRIWSTNSTFLSPTHTIDNAHMSGAIMTSVCFSRGNNLLATRAMDDTLKLWDMRKLVKPISIVPDLVNFFEETDVVFSPNDRYILTGTSVKKDQGSGKLCIFDRDNLAPVTQIEVARSSVVRVLWHVRINQILTGTGDGSVQVFYDPALSLSGVKTALSKRPKQRAVDEMDTYSDDANRPILTPHALPMFKDDQPQSTKRRRDKLRADPMATRRPDQPLTGPGRGGKVGTNVTQHIMKGLIKDTMRDEDPREAILRHAKDAAENPYWVAPAYKKNQPKAVYAEQVYEDDGEEARAATKKRRQ